MAKNQTAPIRGEELINRGSGPYISTSEIVTIHHDVFLDTDITDPEDYRDLISLLFNASAQDTIRIFFNSGGGDGDAAFAMIEGLKNTQSSVTGVLIGSCHSAASMIAMHCHNVVVLDAATMMIHTATFGSFGNTGNVKTQTEFTVRRIEKLLNESYEGFLNEEELDKIKSGVELWFDADEIRTRMKNRAELINARQSAQPEITCCLSNPDPV